MKDDGVITNYLLGFNHEETMVESFGLLDDTYEFSSPGVYLGSKRDFIHWMSVASKLLYRLELLEVVEGKGLTVALYVVMFEHPLYKSMLVTEWFVLADGKIMSSRLLYDRSTMDRF
ncbi:hypothetical protein D2V08_03325 [Flagellimonas lutimaris]|uniref:Nuclear transport factor 2 family protein n=1 Tax=Flagellimonas lutimaris TaxID=475082 RepID=A0A3A1NA44_9FLAO|nr:hypothetical protein [Allomuricauda lutimaris]RIV35990.1 hypothetical protein D2V08_03325 [Allomuricauda lutimaris]